MWRPYRTTSDSFIIHTHTHIYIYAHYLVSKEKNLILLMCFCWFISDLLCNSYLTLRKVTYLDMFSSYVKWRYSLHPPLGFLQGLNKLTHMEWLTLYLAHSQSPKHVSYSCLFIISSKCKFEIVISILLSTSEDSCDRWVDTWRQVNVWSKNIFCINYSTLYKLKYTICE